MARKITLQPKAEYICADLSSRPRLPLAAARRTIHSGHLNFPTCIPNESFPPHGGCFVQRGHGLNWLLRSCLGWRWHLRCFPWCRRFRLPFNELGLFLPLLGQPEAHRHNPVLLLDVGAVAVEAGDLGGHDERLGGDLHRVGLLRPQQTHAARPLQPLDLDLADGVRDPFRRARLGGPEEYLGSRAARAWPRRPGRSAFPAGCGPRSPAPPGSHTCGFGHGGMELWQFVEARQFVQNEPDRLASGQWPIMRRMNRSSHTECSDRSFSRQPELEVRNTHRFRLDIQSAVAKRGSYGRHTGAAVPDCRSPCSSRKNSRPLCRCAGIEVGG
jgi:hypothetical protein